MPRGELVLRAGATRMQGGAIEPGSRRWALHASGLVALVATVLLLGSARPAVFDRDEARFALAVREMREHGELVVPTNWGEPRYHKPILAYWLALASERVLGPGEFALRLPSALAGLVALGATMAFARRRFGARVALRAGAILGTSLAFVVEAHILTADALLLATTTLAFWAWMELEDAGLESGRARAWRVLFWVALALGILAKGVNVGFLAAAACALAWLRAGRPRGPIVLAGVASCAAAIPEVGFLGPVLFALAASWSLVHAGRSASVARVRLGAAWGVPLCLALVGVWFVPALVRSGGEFLSEGVGHHMLERTASAFEGHRGFPGYYVLAALLAFFPWAAWAPAAFVRAWREPRLAFLLAWVVGPWALIECMASKLPHYLLVALPALALLVALEWEQRSAGLAERRRSARVAELVLFALPWLAFAAAGAILPLRTGVGTLYMAGLQLAALATAIALAGVVLLWRADGRAPLLAFAGALGTYLFLCGLVLPALDPFSRRLGATIASYARPSETIHLQYRPASLGCYLPSGHPIVQDGHDFERALAELHPGLYVLEDERVASLTGAHPEAFANLVGVRGTVGLRTRTVFVLRVEGR